MCVQLHRLRGGDAGSVGTGTGTGTGGTGTDRTGDSGGGGGPGAAGPDTARGWEALERAVIGKAVDLLSGPGGLASFLRRRQLGPASAGRACRWTSGSAGPSRPASATR